MGGVIAEKLAEQGSQVTLLTPAAYVSDWSRNTLDQSFIHQRLVSAGVSPLLNRGLAEIKAGQYVSECVYTGSFLAHDIDGIVLVTSQIQNDSVWRGLESRQNEWSDAGIKSVRVIGDAEAPAPIAWATYAGHRYARLLDTDDIGDTLPFKREVAQLSS